MKGNLEGGRGRFWGAREKEGSPWVRKGAVAQCAARVMSCETKASPVLAVRFGQGCSGVRAYCPVFARLDSLRPRLGRLQ